MERKITLPLTEELAKTLHSGDRVLVTGTIYTSRDAGHKRMCEALAKGEKIPFDPKDATIYYVGPTPAKPGQVIGSAGPTTSGRRSEEWSNGCLRTNYDVCRRKRNDWKRCTSSRSN